MFGPYIHDIDPVIGAVFGVLLWWYGLSYTLGFLNAHRFVSGSRGELGLPMTSVYDLSLLLAAGVLLGGRLVEVVFYEWPFYRDHLFLIPAVWIGGMATHGLLFGGLAGAWLFCRLKRKAFLSITDALALPAAFILGVGRIGNFIDGQIVGSVTPVWWAVKFPDAEGFRHPVVLYDGLKNLLIIPVLWYAKRWKLPRGALTGIFLFLYAFFRIFVDLYREYPTNLFGMATGQVLNLLMSVMGLALMVFAFLRRHSLTPDNVTDADDAGQAQASTGIAWRRMLFTVLLLFSLVIPSDWTQDVPARYGKRHAGLAYSSLYPRIEAPAKSAPPKDHSADDPPNQPAQPTR